MMETAIRIALFGGGEEIGRSEITKEVAWGNPWAAVGRIGA